MDYEVNEALSDLSLLTFLPNFVTKSLPDISQYGSEHSILGRTSRRQHII
jgi:hypothetical protein